MPARGSGLPLDEVGVGEPSTWSTDWEHLVLALMVVLGKNFVWG